MAGIMHALRAIFPSIIHSGGGGGVRGGGGTLNGMALKTHSLEAGVNKNLQASLKYLQAFSSQWLFFSINHVPFQLCY